MRTTPNRCRTTDIGLLHFREIQPFAVLLLPFSYCRLLPLSHVAPNLEIVERDVVHLGSFEFVANVGGDDLLHDALAGSTAVDRDCDCRLRVR